MAKDKKSFVLYSDSQGLINQLPDDVAGRLLKHIYAYVNDENPSSDELLINVAFEPIKMQFKRDLVKWENTKEARSVAGKASVEARKLLKENQQNLTNLTNVNLVQQTSTNLTVNDNVNVNVIIKDNIEERKLKFANSLKPFLLIYGKDLLNDFYGYWTQHGENDRKFLAEKQKSFGIERRLETWKRNEKTFNKQPLKVERL